MYVLKKPKIYTKCTRLKRAPPELARVICILKSSNKCKPFSLSGNIEIQSLNFINHKFCGGMIPESPVKICK